MPRHRKLGLGLVALQLFLAGVLYLIGDSGGGFAKRRHENGYKHAPAIPFETARVPAANQALHDKAVALALNTTPPASVMEPGTNNIGWISHERPKMRINAHGGKDIFPVEFSKLGWTKLELKGNPSSSQRSQQRTNEKEHDLPFVRVSSDWTTGISLFPSSSSSSSSSTSTPTPRSTLTHLMLEYGLDLIKYITAVMAVLLIVPDRLLIRPVRALREGARAPHTTALVATAYCACWFWQYFSAASLQAGQVSTTTLQVSADNTFNVKAYANGVSTAFPIRLIIALVSPSFHLMDQFKLWQYDIGPGCLVLNHQQAEYKNFQKGRFLAAVDAWSKKNGCDGLHHSKTIPPTYFLTSNAVNSNGNSDCAELFKGGGKGAGKEDAVWFLKDPAKDGFGMGVSVHSMPDLMKMHGISSNEAALDHKGLRHTCNKLSTKLTRENTKLLVQRGVDPLLLDGSRKFDIRLYVAISDRAPYALYHHWAYLRFSDSATDKTKLKPDQNGQLDRSQHIANIFIQKKKHSLAQHWYPQDQFGTLLDAPEAKPILDALNIPNGQEAAARAERNILGALEQSFKAMRPNAGVKRGGFLLLGVDVLLDEHLHAYVLESNVDPEFGVDAIRRPLMEQAASSLFQLVAETHAKSVHLFGGEDGPGDHPRGKCFATKYSPVKADTAAGKALIKTSAPGWTLLYTEAVEPAYSIVGRNDVNISPKRVPNTRGDGYCFQQA